MNSGLNRKEVLEHNSTTRAWANIELEKWKDMNRKIEAGDAPPLKFEVVMHNDPVAQHCIKSVLVDPKDVGAAIEQYLRGFVAERAVICGVEEKVKAQLDRKIDVVCKEVVQRLQSMYMTTLAEELRKRIIADVAKMPINIEIKIG